MQVLPGLIIVKQQEEDQEYPQQQQQCTINQENITKLQKQYDQKIPKMNLLKNASASTNDTIIKQMQDEDTYEIESDDSDDDDQINHAQLIQAKNLQKINCFEEDILNHLQQQQPQLKLQQNKSTSSQMEEEIQLTKYNSNLFNNEISSSQFMATEDQSKCNLLKSSKKIQNIKTQKKKQQQQNTNNNIIKQSQNSNNNNKNKNSNYTQDDGELLKCYKHENCRYQTYKRKHLLQHYRRCHGPKSKKVFSPQGEFVCEACGRHFLLEEALEYHIIKAH